MLHSRKSYHIDKLLDLVSPYKEDNFQASHMRGWAINDRYGYVVFILLIMQSK